MNEHKLRLAEPPGAGADADDDAAYEAFKIRWRGRVDERKRELAIREGRRILAAMGRAPESDDEAS
jgi:hypothetical protein